MIIRFKPPHMPAGTSESRLGYHRRCMLCITCFPTRKGDGLDDSKIPQAPSVPACIPGPPRSEIEHEQGSCRR